MPLFTGIVGRPAGQVVPLVSTTKRSKQINLVVTPSAATSASRAKAIFYADSTGLWRMQFQIEATFSVATSGSEYFTVPGIVIQESPRQSIFAGWGGAANTQGNFGTAEGVNRLYCNLPPSALTTAYLFGDIFLTGEPTWASLGTTWAQIAETPGDIYAYLPMADASTAGLLMLKTPTISTLTSGSGTYAVPAGVLRLRVRMVGGGAGGGGSGSASNGNGGAGGNTTFGVLAANGASAGADLGKLAGAGGTATLGGVTTGIALAGGTGQSSINATGTYLNGNSGAASPFGGAGGGAEGNSAGISAVANTGSGGGGAGGGIAGTTSGNGGSAGGYVEAFLNTVTATYAYSVGAAGTAGTAGTGGYAGGTGGSGIIIIEGYYY